MALNEPAWNPTEEDVTPLRGRHRLPKQRSISRNSVLGVATIAAVGVGGVATATEKSPVSISLPDLDVSDLPGLGDGSSDTAQENAAAKSSANASDPTELLRERILAQAAGQRAAADEAESDTAEKDAADAAKEAAAKKVRDAAAKKAAAKKAADAKKAEEERKAAAGRFTLPTSNYTITATFGQAGSQWTANHTGLDFAAPTGTAVVAVGSGEITSAGWAGSFGYRIIVTHPDGTETWYCHLSSMVQTSGQVTTGQLIGRVGATGNVTGAHLHLEVHPGGGDAIDPAPWLRSKGLTV